MKKIYSFFLLLGLLLSVGNVWAVDVVFSPSDFTATDNDDYSLTKSGITVAVTASTVTADQMRIFKNKSMTISSTVGNISNIAFVCTANGTAKYGPGCFAELSGYTYEQSGPNGTWTGSAQSVTFTASSNQVRITSLTVTISGASSPAISADNVNVAYDATAGSIAYTVNNSVTGGAISAEITEGDWLNLGQDFTSPIAFTCVANPNATARTATVKLTYTYNTSETVIKNVTVTQAANPNAFDNISSIVALGTAYKVKGTVVAVNSKAFVIGDGTGYVYVYLNAAPNYSVGDMVIVNGTTGSYGRILQFTSTATITSAETSSYDGTPSVTVVDADAMAAYDVNYQLSDYVQFEGALAKSGIYYEITVGTAKARISYANATQTTALEALLSKKVRVKGYFAGFSSSTFTVMMESVEEVLVPSVTVASYTINATDAGAAETVVVTYNNITDVAADVAFYQADGTTPATYDWVTANIDGSNNLEYLIVENTGAARNAYLKVWAYDDELNEVYSELITISQEAVSYATLPFAYDGNGTGNLPFGLTPSGLGTYSSSPKMQFNGTGDNLILKINENPGVLLFDIKGNSYSSGSTSTFKVQTSVDGENYTDLETYTELGATQTESFNLASNVRFIKWIYTEKGASSGGNVALGNIKLLKQVVLGANGWSTFSADFKFAVTGAEVYMAAPDAELNATKVILSKVENGIVPAEEGVILKGTEGATVTITPTNAEASDYDDNFNDLMNTAVAPAVASVGSNMYVLATYNNVTAFYPCGDITIPMNKAWMFIFPAQQGGAPDAIRIEFAENNATDIKSVEGSEKAVKFIENGKLYIQKDGVVYDVTGAVVR